MRQCRFAGTSRTSLQHIEEVLAYLSAKVTSHTSGGKIYECKFVGRDYISSECTE